MTLVREITFIADPTNKPAGGECEGRSRHDRRSIDAQIMHCSSDKEPFLARNPLYHVPLRHDADTKIKATGRRKNGNGRCLRYEIGDPFSKRVYLSACEMKDVRVVHIN